MVLVSADTVAMVQKPAQPPQLDHILRDNFKDLDLILVEGYKTSTLPKIEIHRRELARPLLCRGENADPHLLAVASDGPAACPQDLDVPVLDLKDPRTIADFIVENLLKSPPDP
jgi:molybdopterin-guanine dinucleotide biosynthesis protein MobB